jgi:hypothetical protein
LLPAEVRSSILGSRQPKYSKKIKVKGVLCLLEGHDGLFQQTVAARQDYYVVESDSDEKSSGLEPRNVIQLGRRFKNMISRDEEDDCIVIDYAKIHQTLPSAICRSQRLSVSMSMPNCRNLARNSGGNGLDDKEPEKKKDFNESNFSSEGINSTKVVLAKATEQKTGDLKIRVSAGRVSHTRDASMVTTSLTSRNLSINTAALSEAGDQGDPAASFLLRSRASAGTSVHL